MRHRLTILIVTLHILFAAAWWWSMPHGFLAKHSRFWLNDVAPIIVIISALSAFRWRVMALAFPALWLAAAVSGITTFPHDFRIASPIIALLSAAMLWAIGTPRPSARRTAACAIALGIVVGGIAPRLVKPGAPRTRPLDIPFAVVTAQASAYAPFQRIGSGAGVSPNTGHISTNVGRVRLDIAPLLTFVSRSIDGAPVIFASRSARLGPTRTVAEVEHPNSNSIVVHYADDDASLLRVAEAGEREISIDAFSRLPREVYSHLNSFTEIDIVGHKRLQIAFSPCGDTRFDVNFSEYPTGKPARFAYFDVAREMLRVVEARDAEKGPFTTLGEGALKRGEALTITLFDEDRAIGSITFDDWSAQASDALSPTAGWRVSANSIVFARYFDQPDSVAGIWISLADTGVGRGWDTVGHARGTYRNRMRIARLTDQ